MTRRAAAWLWHGMVVASLIALVGWPLVDITWRLVQSAGRSDFPPPIGRIARPWTLAWQTLQLVGLTELLAMPLGVALAFVLERTNLLGRNLGRLLVLGGLFIPLPLHAIFWLGAFGNQGRQQLLGEAPWLVGLAGAAVVHAVASLPWVVLIVVTGLRLVEPELEELGLLHWPSWRVAWSITLRRSLGAIASAALAVAILCAGDMTVADLIPLRTFAEEAYTLAQQGGPLEAAAARATWPQILALGCVIFPLMLWLARRDPARLAALSAPVRSWDLGRARPLVFLATWLLIIVLVGVPVYGLVWRAGRVGTGLVAGAGARWSLAGLLGTLASAWSDLVPPWGDLVRGDIAIEQSPLCGSLLWSALAATMATGLGMALVYRARVFRVWQVLTLFVAILLLATPAPVIGVVFKLSYGRVYWLGATPTLLVLGLIARLLPYAVLILWPAVAAIPAERFELAATSGLGPAAQFRRVVLPATLHVIAATWLLTTALAFGELPTSYMLQAPGFELISVLTWTLLHNGVESRLSGVTLWLLAVLGMFTLTAALIIARSGDRD